MFNEYTFSTSNIFAMKGGKMFSQVIPFVNECAATLEWKKISDMRVKNY